MTISESLLEKGKMRADRASHPVDPRGAAANRRASQERDARTRSTARRAYEAKNGDRNYFMWSTPKAFAFFAMLIVLALLFAQFLTLPIE